jgi:hypothetical protein
MQGLHLVDLTLKSHQAVLIEKLLAYAVGITPPPQFTSTETGKGNSSAKVADLLYPAKNGQAPDSSCLCLVCQLLFN